jgi:hypothetical protein
MTPVKSSVAQLKQGEYLTVGQNLQSPNGQFTATLESGGKIVLRHIIWASPLWSTGVVKTSTVSKLFLQYDGNLVMLDAKDTQVWESKTFLESGDTSLKLNDDGNITIACDGKPWSSNIPVLITKSSLVDVHR